MKKVPRLFLYGYYGFGNIGDDLLLRSVVSSVLKFDSSAQFVVRSLYPVESAEPSAQIEFATLEQVMLNRRLSKFRRVGRYLLSAWWSLAGCTHLVFGGGTLFHAHGNSQVNLVLIFALVVMARMRGIKIYALGVGVAPLTGILPKYLMRGILALANDFAVRDESSLRNCRGTGSKGHLRLTADLVFSLPLSNISKTGAGRRRPVVGITLAASDIDNYLDQRGFLEQLAIALELLTKDGWSICFLAFQELSLEGSVVSDTALFERTRSLCPNLECSVIRMSANSADIADVYGQIDVVAGMRFHGHVLAAMLGLPFVGFGRDEKLKDLCSYMLMPFLNMENLVADRLASDINRVRTMESDAKRVRGLSCQSIDNFTKIGASLL